MGKLKILLQLLVASLIFLIQINKVASRDHPVIAILANPVPDNAVEITRSRVNAQYVHWLEQSLADVVVIQPWYEEEQIEEILSKVNGVLFPGGDRNLTLSGHFEKVSGMILEKVARKFDREGVTIPVWGTCQGFELLHVLIADSLKVLTGFEANQIQTPVTVNNQTINTSKMFTEFTQDDLFNLQNKNTTAQFHHFGVSETQYEKYPKLKETFVITTYGQDIYNKNYIASIEGRKYPFYAVQFHPEMVPYSRNSNPGVPHSLDALKISQHFSRFLIREALRNNNYMSPEDMIKFDHINSFTKLPELASNGGYYYYFFNRETKSFLK